MTGQRDSNPHIHVSAQAQNRLVHTLVHSHTPALVLRALVSHQHDGFTPEDVQKPKGRHIFSGPFYAPTGFACHDINVGI